VCVGGGGGGEGGGKEGGGEGRGGERKKKGVGWCLIVCCTSFLAPRFFLVFGFFREKLL